MAKTNYLFSKTIELVDISYKGTDKYGNTKIEEVKTKLFCNETAVSRREFYDAGNVGYKVSYNIVLNDFEYKNQPKAIYKGKEYSILKSYPLPNGAIEITLAERIGNNGK